MHYIKRGMGIFCFLSGFLVLLLISSYIFMPKNNMKEYGMEEVRANGILGEKENTIDVLVVGDSESYSAISPMQIWRDAGFTVYNSGTSGQTLDYTNLLIKRTFENQNPKIVILETHNIFIKVKDTMAFLTRLGNIFSIFHYHDRWKNISLNDITSKVNYTWTDDFKGYTHSTVIDSCDPGEYMTESADVETCSKENIQYIKEIKDFCDEKGAKLILLSTPSPVNWSYPRHNGISRLASEIGCDYLDLNLYNKEMDINWSKDTRDRGDHLNSYGASKVTKFVTDYLQKTGLCIDHREDAVYKKWNESLLRYEGEVKI